MTTQSDKEGSFKARYFHHEVVRFFYLWKFSLLPAIHLPTLRPSRSVLFYPSWTGQECPGKKFAQVDSLSPPVAKHGENMESVKGRMGHVAADSSIVLLL